MTEAGGFADRYRAAVAARGRLCAGIDPHPELLEQWGLPVSAQGVAQFGDICVEALGPVAAVVKPQVAFFEAFGSPGIAALERVIAGCGDAGALVVADAKRGDIGSTMAAYARAWLGEHSPLRSDAVTVSPYLGFGALAPAVDEALFRLVLVQSFPIPGFFLLSVPVALLAGPNAAQLSWLLAIPASALLPRIYGRRTEAWAA